MVAPGLRPDAATEMVDRMETILTHIRKNFAGDNGLSVSIGQSFYPTDGSNAEELLVEADRRMYGVKKQHHSIRAAHAAAR